MTKDSQSRELPPSSWRSLSPVPHLAYFHEVARCGSIRMAADNLHVAPSAISRQIQKLELQIGFPLFERLPRGVALTSAGSIFARYARDSLLSLDRVRSELDEIQNIQRGHVRLYTIEGLVADYIAPLIGEFLSGHENVTFDLFITGTEQITQSLIEGIADVGFAFNLAPSDQIEKVFSVRDPIRAAMAPDHALAQRKSVSLEELFSFPLAVPEKRFGMRYLIDVACREQDCEIPTTLETNSLEALRAFARNGSGISFLHTLSITQDIRHGRLVTVPIGADALERGAVDACILKARPLPISAEIFLERANTRLKEISEAIR